MSVVERAFAVAAATLDRAPRDGLAHPFGFDIDTREHRWRVSRDVWADLVVWAGMGDPEGPSPDAALIGLRIAVDEALPPDSMLLEPTA